jgi:hypothetical protein
MKPGSIARLAALLGGVAASTGCHSYHIETTIENRTGEPIQLLEVDYPAASFGKDSLAADADYHYRIQVRGSGQIKVQYSLRSGEQKPITGPELAEGQEGRLEIVLLPGDKAEFRTELSPRR